MFTHRLPPVAAPVYLQPLPLTGGPCPWLLFTGSAHSTLPHRISPSGAGVRMAPSVP